MQEAFLHYIWKNSLFENKEYIADNKEKIKILKTGEHNHNSGPDFTQAKIVIDGTVWAGNVEIHVNGTDWNNHRHNNDDTYNNVILHIVENPDGPCHTKNGRTIPTIRLTYDRSIQEKYSQLVNSFELISCHRELKKLDHSIVSFWLHSLTIERLQSKVNNIEELLRLTKNNWEEVFHIHLLKSLGLKINALPFEMLARATPVKILTKHSNNIRELEALLFGQAGFLNNRPVDQYQKDLQKEYRYLKVKYRLKPVEAHLWKFMRLRPANFPTIRISELSNLVYRSKHLFSRTLECKTVDELVKLYTFEVSDYWKTHYTFGKKTRLKKKSIGQITAHLLIINTVIPLMFTYADRKSVPGLKERSIQLLEDLPAENNTIVKKWKALNFSPRHAADSQALLQLTHKYCKVKRCLDCRIGNQVLKH